MRFTRHFARWPLLRATIRSESGPIEVESGYRIRTYPAPRTKQPQVPRYRSPLRRQLGREDVVKLPGKSAIEAFDLR